MYDLVKVIRTSLFYNKAYMTFQPNKDLLQVYNTQTCINDHQI